MLMPLSSDVYIDILKISGPVFWMYWPSVANIQFLFENTCQHQSVYGKLDYLLYRVNPSCLADNFSSYIKEITVV